MSSRIRTSKPAFCVRRDFLLFVLIIGLGRVIPRIGIAVPASLKMNANGRKQDRKTKYMAKALSEERTLEIA
jgi:hypothetical protein